MQQELDRVHLCTYVPDAYLTYMYNYNIAQIVAGTWQVPMQPQG